jgi:hypothetical protein
MAPGASPGGGTIRVMILGEPQLANWLLPHLNNAVQFGQAKLTASQVK